MVDLARRFSPGLVRLAAQCFELTRDVRDTVRMMIAELHEPARLDTGWVAPWVAP